MNEILKFRYLFCITCSLLFFSSASGQILVNAGISQMICPGDTVILGGTPTALGGYPPYHYAWAASSGEFVDTVPNPSVFPTDLTTYTLLVTDDSGTVQLPTDPVIITLSYIMYINAGLPLDFCLEGSGAIGGVNNDNGHGITYLWSPTSGLNDSSLPQPTAKPIITTEYILTATIAGCPPKIDSVEVKVIQPPPIFAGNDITIKEGETVTLHASGGYYYAWSPEYLLKYYYTANPDAEPIITTDFYLYGTEETKRCFAYDTMTVFVEPCTDVVFYNTFTPNKDGNNDTWYIGNISKYPYNRLEIYNRNGKLVYKANGYSNTWDGKSYLGEELSSATYFYMMDLGEGAGIFHGTVTIVK